MKQAVLSLVFLHFAFASAQVLTSPSLNDSINACDKEFPVSPEMMKELENATELRMDLPENIRCNLKCVAKAEGFLNNDGSYDVEKSVAIIKQGYKLSDSKTEECRKYFEECNKIGTDYKGNEPCMSTFLTARCLVNKLSLLRPKMN